MMNDSSESQTDALRHLSVCPVTLIFPECCCCFSCRPTGALDWSPHLPRIFTHAIGLLEVPVGTSSGPSPVTGSPTPRRVVRLFMPLFVARGEAGIAARTIVHLLKSTPARPHTSAAAALALSSLQHLVCLLEQYYHPSNTGEDINIFH